MIESNDPLKLKQQVQARGRRRKSTGWKSGLMLTGLGAVVAGAGYLAGVNAPAVSQSTASQTIARAGATTGDNQSLAPGANSLSPNQGQVFQFNGDDNSNNPFTQQFGDDGGSNGLSQQFGDGNVGDDGTSGTGGLGQQSGGGSGTSGSNGLSQQFGGRRNRQFRGFSQQQPGFGGPVTRSRGS